MCTLYVAVGDNMSLLPKTHTEFAAKSYWDAFFSKKFDSFEWYGSYQDLCGLLHKYSKSTSKVLVAGCGNSTLSEDLYDVGYRDIHSVDISGICQVIAVVLRACTEVYVVLLLVRRCVLHKLSWNSSWGSLVFT